jgi:hypothetical protein
MAKVIHSLKAMETQRPMAKRTAIPRGKPRVTPMETLRAKETPRPKDLRMAKLTPMALPPRGWTRD